MKTMLIIAIVISAAFFAWKKASPSLALFRRGPASRGASNCRSCGGCASPVGNKVNRILASATILAVMSGAVAAEAADTVETWDVGATDVDFYLGMDNLGLSREEGGVFGDLMLGYGLIEGFSAYIGTTLKADRTLGQSDHQHYLGMFGTPIESDHVDFDLFLDFTGFGSELTITPSFELNLDRDPDMSSFGFYLRSGLVFSHVPPEAGAIDSSPEVGTTIEINPGAYWSLSGYSQILLEYSTGYFSNPAAEEDRWDTGHVHFGYNHTLMDEIELITEVNWAIEKTDGATSWGGFVGIIATLPSAMAQD